MESEHSENYSTLLLQRYGKIIENYKQLDESNYPAAESLLKREDLELAIAFSIFPKKPMFTRANTEKFLSKFQSRLNELRNRSASVIPINLEEVTTGSLMDSLEWQAIKLETETETNDMTAVQKDENFELVGYIHSVRDIVGWARKIELREEIR